MAKQYKKSEETRRKIAQAASELFFQKGYFETTVKDICDRSGVSVSRVNYHFVTKADLAAYLCTEFLDNFYQKVKQFIGNNREFSLVSEAIQLRFFVKMLLSDKGDSSRFYKEIAREGILSQAFTRTAKSRYRIINSTIQHVNMDETRISIAAHFFASALTGLVDPLQEQFKDQDVPGLMDAYARLFMQIADVRHDVQENILLRAREYGQNIGFRLQSLTEVELFALDPA